VQQARHWRQRRVVRRQRCAPRPHQRILPRGFGRQVRALRGALRPQARRDRRCNHKSPLGDLFSPENFVNHTRGQKGKNWDSDQTTTKGSRTIFLTPPCIVAAFIVNSEPHTGARPSVRLCVGPMLPRCVYTHTAVRFMSA
jgi:hypothetical protein